MKSKDLNKQEQQSKQNTKIAAKSNRPMTPKSKVKYKHKNHWLAQEDEDFDLPILNYEEE